MTTPKGARAEMCITKLAGNSVAQEHRSKGESSNTCTKNKGEANVKHFGKSTSFPTDGKNGSLYYETEKLCVQELNDNIPKAVSCQKEHPSIIIHGQCEKREPCNTPNISRQEIIITEHEKGTSQPRSESDKYCKNGILLKEQGIEVVQTDSESAGECKNGQINSAEELVTVKTECGTPSGSLQGITNTESSITIVDKKKEQRNMKKRLAKDEKRRQRELEFRKNLEFPMGQRVQVVDHNTFQKILKDSDSSHNEKKSLGLSFDEFPALNLVKNEDKFSTNLNQQFSVLQNRKITRKFDRTLNHVKQHKKESESHSIATREMVHKTGSGGGVKKAGKPPRKRDPIQIDILHCIKMVKPKDPEIDSKRRSSSVEKGSRRKESSLISGNELDSSNPQRSKGKKREQPRRKRQTKLKLVILHERELKNHMKELESLKPSQENQECIEESVCTNAIITTAPKSDQINCENSTQECKDQCQFYSLKDLTRGSSDSQSLITQKDRQLILQRETSIVGEQENMNVGHNVSHLLLSDSNEKERPEVPTFINQSYPNVDSEEHFLSISTGDDEKELIQLLSNTENDCPHSLQNKQSHSSFENETDAIPGAISASHQEKHKKTSTDKISDTVSSHNEDLCQSGLHSRKFRPYCDHMITPEINSYVRSLLQDIVKFHDRHYERDPVKANVRRRHVTGLREVLKYLNLKRLKLIIIAPDLELIESKGGICDIVEQLKEGARTQEIPYVFALHRRALGKITFKKVPVSCVGVISYDGTEKNFHALMEVLPEAKNQYQEALVSSAQKHASTREIDVNNQVIASILSKLTEKSTPILREEIKDE